MRFLRHWEFGFATRLAALYGAIFVMNGIQLPFLPVWLRAKGLDAQAIGLVLAIPMVVRVFAIAGAARVADRHDAVRASILVACCASALCYALVGASKGVVVIALTYTLASLVMAPVVPLTETYALRGLSSQGKAYGPVRLWGSAAFIAGSFAAGFASDIMPARDLIWLIVGATAVMAITAVVLSPLPPHPPHAEPASQRKSLLRDPVFVAMLTAASLIQSSHAVYYSFSALAWRARGLEGSTVAGLWALGVIAEIVLFAFSGRLPPALTPPVLIMIGSAGGLLRWGGMAFDPPVALLPWLQLLHALTFGTTYLGALMFVARRASPGQSATAQGYLAVATGLATAAATGLSGQLYAAYGVRAYAAMALAAVAGGACALVADQLGRRVSR
jgi:MFS transporter, PPP family, 3-phenylpropionic acid transporter